MSAVIASTTTANHAGVGPCAWVPTGHGSSRSRTPSPTAENASSIVRKFSQAKLPESMSQPWVTTTTAAPDGRDGLGREEQERARRAG